MPARRRILCIKRWVAKLPQVQPDEALATANQLALEYQIWERPLGLAGVWGGLVRAWLDALLPDDAHVQCSGRVKLVVTEVRSPPLIAPPGSVLLCNLAQMPRRT